MQQKSKPKPVSAAKPSVPSEAAKAFAMVEPVLARFSTAELAPINVDISSAVSIAVGAVPHLAKLREKAAKLPDFDIANIDRLGTYAMAAWYAHLLALPAVASTKLGGLLEEAKPLREDMLLSAELLARKGDFDAEVVGRIRAGHGNLDMANDLVALAALFSAGWSRVQNRTTVEWHEVERATTLGPEILIALGERDRPVVEDPDPTSPAERRARAYTLLVRAYDQCRRAASFLRWNEGDADDFAPSLLSGRAGRRIPAPASDAPTDADPAPPADKK